MDLSYSEEQQISVNAVHEMFQRENPPDVIKEVMRGTLDYNVELYQKLAQLGWHSLLIPAQYGGIDSTLMDALLFYEEAGRSLLICPHFSSVIEGGQIILNFGKETQKQELLPLLCKGKILVSAAFNDLYEPSCRSSCIRISKEGDKLSVSGKKLFAPYAYLSDYIITFGQTSDDKYVLLLLKRGETTQIRIDPLDCLGGEKLAMVDLNHVNLSEDDILSFVDRTSFFLIMDIFKILRCAEAFGCALACLQMATEYIQQREQFGEKIVSFQALRHKLVDMVVELQSLKWLLYWTAWSLDKYPLGTLHKELPASKDLFNLLNESRTLFPYTFRICSQVVSGAMHILGAVGVMKDHIIGSYYERIKFLTLSISPFEMQRKDMYLPLGEL